MKRFGNMFSIVGLVFLGVGVLFCVGGCKNFNSPIKGNLNYEHELGNMELSDSQFQVSPKHSGVRYAKTKQGSVINYNQKYYTKKEDNWYVKSSMNGQWRSTSKNKVPRPVIDVNAQQSK